MEDWAYAASWENSFGSDSDSIFTPCTPTQYGPYPAHKTTYNNKTHRAFNILVETSDLKRPAQTALGLRSSLYNVDLQVRTGVVQSCFDRSYNIRRWPTIRLDMCPKMYGWRCS
ncbi:hypothetical protein DYB37_005296 [Aphanomyces astaci]|uniref:Uncharacterized protein n=1 Tax=Aphanomyces astaci TaxID=112090 RepID=A0A3R7AV01_APHAT|nr:hypothetical protein DYB37_005296 [Aphanomyces astaci]